MDFDPCQAWYHGSTKRLSVLRSGSTITQKQDLARVFSHNPSIVSMSDDGTIKHNGTQPGFLYVVAEEVLPEDIIQHPHSTMQVGDEWLTTRDLNVFVFSPTVLVPEEQLTDEELAELLQHSARSPK